MEPIGLAVGIVGLAGLFSTCLDIIEKVDAFKDFEADSQPLFSLYEAYKLLFQQWGHQVGIFGELEESHHKALDDPETAAVVNKILLSIQSLFERTELAFPELRSENKTGSQNKLPQIAKRGKLKWAIKGKATFVNRIKEFGDLVQALHNLVPLQGSENFHSQLRPDQEPRNDLTGKTLDFSDIARVLADVETQIEENRRKDLDAWLDASWTTDLFDNFVRRRLDGTCSWMLNRQEFRDWISPGFYSPTSPKILWVNGVPGSGKTILCASLVQDLSKQFDLLAYYFISSNTKSREDPFVSIRSWISQIIAKSQEARNLAYSRLESRATTAQTASRKEILDLFEDIVESIPGCTFVVDGLDECTWKSEESSTSDDDSPTAFLKAIRQAISLSATRLLVVSRDNPEIRDGLYGTVDGIGTVPHEYRILPNDVNADITSFSRNLVNTKLARKSEAFRETLSDKIAKRCDGMFLWVKMLGDELRGGKSQSALETIVNGTPTALDRLYDKNWDKICRLPDQDKTRAMSILRWTTCSRRPLSISELTEALLILPDGQPSGDDFPDEIDMEYIETEILDLCGSLLEHKTLVNPKKEALSTVQPIHFSARQYIMSNLPFEGLSANGRLFSSSEHYQHYMLAKICLHYINQDDVWQGKTCSNVTVPFRDYAAGSWYGHIRVVGQTTRDLDELINGFLTSENKNWQSWREWYDTNRLQRQTAPSILQPSPLFYASSLGLLETVRFLVNEGGIDINYCHDAQGTALCAAAAEGHEEVAKFLLSKGADANIQIKTGGLTAFHIACMYGNTGIVELLIDHVTDINLGTSYARTPLFMAANCGNVSIVEILLERGADMARLDKARHTPLNAASVRGHTEVVRLLIEKGADITLAGNGEWSPLNLAAANGHLAVIKILLDNGSDTEPTRSEGWTPLHLAANTGHMEVVKFLLSRVDQTVVSESGWTALGLASNSGFAEVVKLLLEDVADMTTIHNCKRDPLVEAAAEGHYEVVKLLLEKGANVEAADKDGWTSLERAVTKNHVDVVKLLVENGADLDVANDSDGWTPLNDAAGRNHIELVKLLLQKGADMEISTNLGWTPLNNAADEGHAEVVKLLLDHGANIEASTTKTGWTPLNNASDAGHTEVVKLLLERGANPENPTNGGSRPLFVAAGKGHARVVKLLVEKGADMEASNGNGWTALHNAAEAGHMEVIIVLLEKGANIETGTDTRWTPLNIAVDEGHTEVARCLLEHGAGINVASDRGWTPLYTAVDGGHAELVPLLLENGANIEASNDTGWTAINSAANNGYVEPLRILLEQGADFNTANNSGWTPLLNACSKGHKEVVTILLEHGVDIKQRNRMNNRTALIYAAWNGRLDLVNLLLRREDVDPNLVDYGGRSALFYAVKGGYPDVVKTLCDDPRVEIDTRNLCGVTPLSVAARVGSVKSTELLLTSRRVDVNSEDCFGRTPLWYARRNRHDEAAQLLIRAMESKDILEGASDTPAALWCEEIPGDIKSDYWCDICLVTFAANEEAYSCKVCDGGDFLVCLECYDAGGWCYESSHELIRERAPAVD